MNFFAKHIDLALILFVAVLLSASIPAVAQGGYTLDFDGTDEYVEAAYDASLNPTNFTLEAWAKVEGGAGNFRSVMTSRKISNTGGYMIYVGADNQWQFWTGNNTLSGWNTQSSGVAASSEWTHIACSYDGTNKNIYINGVLAISSVESYAPNTTRPLRIGVGATESTPDFYFPGKIDEVRIWSDVRTQAEIQANMHKELVGNEANLEAYYQMSNGAGTSLTDNSSNSNTGTLTNAPVWKTSGAHAGPDMALNFDGGNDYVSIGDQGSLENLTEMTLEAWINPDIITTAIAQIINKDKIYFMTLYKDGSGNDKVVVGFENGADYSQPNLVSNSNLETGVWTHLVVTRGSSGLVKLYINGVLDNSYTNATTASNNSDFRIGASSINTQYFDGQIDEVRIWSTARTEAEIRANKDRALDGDETGLVAYYRFDQQSDAGNATLYDQTSNGYDGTLTNMDAATDWVASSPFNTWIGADDSDWSNGDNWSSGSVPASSSLSEVKQGI